MQRRKLKNGHTNGNGIKRPVGRPGVYGPDKVELAAKLAKYGHTDFEIADILGLDVRSVYKWASQHEEFGQALKLGKEMPDERVKRSLYHRACGYSFNSEKIFCNKDGDVTTVPYVEHVPPDTTAAIFWLKNRDAASWRENANGNVNQAETDISIQDAQVQLLARVFGVATRLAARQAESISARTIEAE